MARMRTVRSQPTGLMRRRRSHELGHAEQAHGHRDHLDPVRQFDHAEREAELAGIDVGPDDAEEQAHIPSPSLSGDPWDTRGRDQAQQHDREILGRGEISAKAARAGRKPMTHMMPNEPAKNEAMRQAERDAALPCLVSGWPSRQVTAEAGRPGQVEQDRGDRAAVLRPVKDARQHDQRGGRRRGGTSPAGPSRWPPAARCPATRR